MIPDQLHKQYFKVIRYLVDKKITDSKCDEELISYETQKIYMKLITEFFKIDIHKYEDVYREADKDVRNHESLLVDYDDRYFAHCKHNRAELYEEQKHIISIIHDGSSDILKDLDSKIDEKEIDLMLQNAYQKGLIKRERTGMIIVTKFHKMPIYRYFT